MATINISRALQPSTTPTTNKVREEPIGDSSWLAKIKYDPSTFQLTVTTKEGSEYVHFMVYPMTVDQMMQAPSKGRFYATQIKGHGLANRVIDKTVGASLRNPAKGPTDKKPGRGRHGR